MIDPRPPPWATPRHLFSFALLYYVGGGNPTWLKRRRLAPPIAANPDHSVSRVQQAYSRLRRSHPRLPILQPTHVQHLCYWRVQTGSSALCVFGSPCIWISCRRHACHPLTPLGAEDSQCWKVSPQPTVGAARCLIHQLRVVQVHSPSGRGPPAPVPAPPWFPAAFHCGAVGAAPSKCPASGMKGPRCPGIPGSCSALLSLERWVVIPGHYPQPVS